MRLLLLRIARFTRTRFWLDASEMSDSVTRLVMPGVVLFGGIAAVIGIAEHFTDPHFSLGSDVTPYEVGGAALGMLLVLRTNEGIGRWWEARKLWGGIVNQCRNIAVGGLAYGPRDEAWRRSLTRWTIVFAHACRRSLRGEKEIPEIAALLGEREAAALLASNHMPTAAALVIGRLLRVGLDRGTFDRFAFVTIDTEKNTLIDHIGGCERILKTPLPKAYSIQIRRFIALFLVLLPFGLLPKTGEWLTPIITMLVAYPLLSLDRIGAELQNPFALTSLNHLDLDGITTTIETNLLALIDDPGGIWEVDEYLLAVDGPEEAST